MTTRELIEFLKTLPPDNEVVMLYDYGCVFEIKPETTIVGRFENSWMEQQDLIVFCCHDEETVKYLVSGEANDNLIGKVCSNGR